MKKKLSNKGFSLVELIIVIAIMVVLVGLLAPQYLKFVERSKISTDMQNADAIVSALEVYSTDTTVTDPLLSSGDITITTTATAVGTGNATGNADKALAAAGIDKIGLKSNAKWGTTVTLHFVYDPDNGVVVTATPSDILD